MVRMGTLCAVKMTGSALPDFRAGLPPHRLQPLRKSLDQQRMVMP